MISKVDINISSPQSEILIKGLVSDYIFKNINKIFGITSVQLFNNIITIQEVLVLQVFCAG